MFILSKCALSCVRTLFFFLFKHDSKPTETAPRDEAALINLRRLVLVDRSRLFENLLKKDRPSVVQFYFF